MTADTIGPMLVQLHSQVDDLGKRLAALEGETRTTKLLVQWIILPLLAMVGALVGLRMVLPGGAP